jgi:uncharacterized protein
LIFNGAVVRVPRAGRPPPCLDYPRLVDGRRASTRDTLNPAGEAWILATMGRISVLPRALVASAALGMGAFWAPALGVAAAAAAGQAAPVPATKPPATAAPATATAAPATTAPAARSGTASVSGPAVNRSVAPKATPSKTKPGTAAAAKSAKPKLKPKQKPGEVLDVDWRDLLPENERSHYSPVAPPPQHGRLGEGGPPAAQKETTTFNDGLGEMVVRMPGFVVPIGTPSNGLVTEFFLVPYIGACIHVPPPPPNQMVYVTSASGIAADAIHEAYWVTGKMRIESRTTSLGTAAYAVSASKVELYEY